MLVLTTILAASLEDIEPRTSVPVPSIPELKGEGEFPEMEGEKEPQEVMGEGRFTELEGERVATELAGDAKATELDAESLGCKSNCLSARSHQGPTAGLRDNGAVGLTPAGSI